MLILSLKTGELFGLQGIALHVLHAAFDLPLVPGHIRLGRQDRNAVVPAEGAELGHQFRVEPVRMHYRRAKIVDHQNLGTSAETGKGVFQAADEVFRRLPKRGLAVRLAAVAQNDAKDVRLATFPVRPHDRRAGAKVNLGFLAGIAFHPSHGQCANLTQMPHESLDAVVTTRESVLADEVLIDPLGAEFLLQLG